MTFGPEHVRLFELSFSKTGVSCIERLLELHDNKPWCLLTPRGPSFSPSCLRPVLASRNGGTAHRFAAIEPDLASGWHTG